MNRSITSILALLCMTQAALCAGRVGDSFGNRGEGETIPSYGAGVRLMLLESQRINLRVDYARSDHGEDAWYLAVTEAF